MSVLKNEYLAARPGMTQLQEAARTKRMDTE